MNHPIVVRVSGSGAEEGRGLIDTLESMLSDIPPAASGRSENPDEAARSIARHAAKRAALLSGSLALPPGPVGLVTVLPDLYLIWRTQRQMVSDLFGVHGRDGELTRSHMLYCLFRHAASQLLRDVAVRSGQRVVVHQLSRGTLRGALGAVGVTVSQRVAGTAAGRWIPLAGAAAVGAYAYWDTMQVASSAQQLLASHAST
ncbi:MAG: hypothetical protein ACREX6_00380 [Casimicrobiaceae bacterium]